MKKFLSMVLAMVMTLSLVTVSAGAKEFPDSDELTGDSDGVYAEAVNVLSEMGIIDGDTDGNFKPKGTLTRGAASKIIACMMLGKTTAESLGTAAAPFKDVPVGSTFAGYIAYCVEQGIIDGYADGTFRPSGALTGYAFQKMLLTALGYDSKIEGYANNPNWRVNVAGRAQQEGILTGLDLSSYSAAEAATREQACLMALNTIKTPLVEYESKGSTITVNGATVSQAASSVKYVTTVDKNRATAISSKRYQTTATGSADAYFVEFGEQYQTDLRRDPTTDDFGRPAYTWTWQKDEIDTYVDYSLLLGEYNTGVTGRALRELIGQSTIDRAVADRSFFYYVDGVLYDNDSATTQYIDHVVLHGIDPLTDLVRGNEDDAGMTKNGVLTQVFLNRDTADGDWELTITSIDTWLAKANSDYNSTAEELSLTAYTSKTVEEATGTMNLKVDVEDVPAIENVKKDDYILIQRSGMGSNSANPVLRVVDVKDVEILSDTTVTQFTKGDKQGSNVHNDARAIDKLTTGGTQYNFSQKCYYDTETLDDYNASLLTNMTYDVYLDEYGYVIGVTVHEGARNYVFVSSYDLRNDTIISRNATATAIFLDGTVQDITVNTKDTNTNIASSNRRITTTTGTESYFTEWTTSVSEQNRFQHNRWYTYTVNTAGVYTLKPADRMLIDDYTSKSFADNEETLNSANLSLKAITGKVTSRTTPSTRAYGNDDSIYITIKPTNVTVDKGASTIQVFDEVEGLYTGVQNVRLTLEKNSKIPDYVYALYDSNNYIIAAIVVGEAQGNISNYAYILSDIKSERYEDGYYYWEFDAVQNGEVKNFSARSRFEESVKVVEDNRYHVVQLLFDGDYVTRATEIYSSNLNSSSDKHGSATNANTKFYTNNEVIMDKVKDDVDVYDVGHGPIRDRYDSNYFIAMDGAGSSDVLYGLSDKTVSGVDYPGISSNRIYATIRFVGNTLHLQDLDANNNPIGDDTGLAVRPSAKAVVVQNLNGNRKITEHSTVDDAINSMRDADTTLTDMQFRGRIVAPLNSGVAQWVVFISDTKLKTGDRTGATSESSGTSSSSGLISNKGDFGTVDFRLNGSDEVNRINRNNVVVDRNAANQLVLSIPVSDNTIESATVTLSVNGITASNPGFTWVNNGSSLVGTTSNLSLKANDNLVITVTGLNHKSTTSNERPVTVPDTVKDVVQTVVIDTKPTVGANEEAVVPNNATVSSTADGKLVLTIPKAGNSNIDKDTEVTLTVDGKVVTGTFVEDGNNFVFTSSTSISNATNAKFSFVKKPAAVTPTEDKPGVTVVEGSGFTASAVDCSYNTSGSTLIISIDENLAKNMAQKSVVVKVYGADRTPDGPNSENGKLIWTCAASKDDVKGTTVTVDFKTQDQLDTAANASVAAAAEKTTVALTQAGKTFVDNNGGKYSDKVEIDGTPTLATEGANEGKYVIKLKGEQAGDVSWGSLYTSKTSTDGLAVALKLPVPTENVEEVKNVKVTTSRVTNKEDSVSADDLTAGGYNLIVFVNSTGTAPSKTYTTETVTLTWCDEAGNAVADPVQFVVDASAVKFVSAEDAFKQEVQAVAAPKALLADMTEYLDTNHANYAPISVTASSIVANRVTLTPVAGSEYKIPTTQGDYKAVWGYGLDDTNHSEQRDWNTSNTMVIPFYFAAPEGATKANVTFGSFTMTGTGNEYTFDPEDTEPGLLLGIPVDTTSKIKEFCIEWTGPNGVTSYINYTLNCTDVTVSR